MNDKKDRHKGHSFAKAKKDVVDPPIEVMAGGFLPAGLRDISDWDKWRKDNEKR